jgi:hypothetical protein
MNAVKRFRGGGELRLTDLTIRRATTAVLTLFASAVVAQTPSIAQSSYEAPEQQSKADLATITVEAQRESLKRQVRTFVSAIAAQRFRDSLARWEKPTTICPQVAGLPREEGEFVLGRLSGIALAAGAPLGPEHCKANFFVIVTEKPEELLKVSRRSTQKCTPMDTTRWCASFGARPAQFAFGTTLNCMMISVLGWNRMDLHQGARLRILRLARCETLPRSL